MKKTATLYLSAREASAELAISPATLYAYVSRGLIRRRIRAAAAIARKTSEA
jgi:predicted site-specific integrase-resolvase